MIPKLIQQVESQHLRKDPLVFEIGDTVDVHMKIQEGDKERIQVFNGIVIARKGGGINENFTVRRIVAGEASTTASRSRTEAKGLSLRTLSIRRWRSASVMTVPLSKINQCCNAKITR